MNKRPAFTLVESVISVFLVGVLLVSALNAVAASAMTQKRMTDRTRGRYLADMLMNEILTKDYEDPDEAPTNGVEATETNGDRTTYDDVDDYHGYTAAVADVNGVALPAYSGWTWSVIIDKVSIAGIADRNGSDTGMKRIQVEATHNGETFATAIGYRSYVWEGFTSEGVEE